MSSKHRASRILGRTALCVIALAIGAGIAKITEQYPIVTTRAAARYERIDPNATRLPVIAIDTAKKKQKTIKNDPSDGKKIDGSENNPAFGKAFSNGLVITGAAARRLILFTFDDGPDPYTTPVLLDRLDEAKIKAVFFLLASRLIGSTPYIRREIAVAREIARRGHIIGSHGLHHRQLPLLDNQGLLAELTDSEEIFTRILGGRPWLIRPPGGSRSARVDQLLAERGYTAMLWNISGADYQLKNAELVFQTWLKVFKRRERENGERGGIVLLHDIYPWSIDCFERILNYLRERNCRLLAKGEELYDIVDDPRLFFQPRGDKPASTEATAADPPADVFSERQARLRAETALRCQSEAEPEKR